MSNRLKNEKSPYLLQHKDNPVDWYPWCEEAFKTAEREDKAVFLSIGYSTCHWCHVMARESFEDPEIAALLNDYVCIKVDREERPDVDAVYMTVCQALTGAGGWPLTVFMTPKQKPFFAGAYFPKNSSYGRQGLRELLIQISYLWSEEREKLLESSEKITEVLNRKPSSSIGEEKADRALLLKGFKLLSETFDSKWGGFGSAPKFPTPHNLIFLTRTYENEGVDEALQMAEYTLKAMACGGIFDHIGGGFARYSTDEQWLIPHFEKMLYDNALLISAYLEAYQITKNSFYSDIARRTADYILNELADSSGGFYCGQDADSDGAEGKYYVFTVDEILRILGEKDGLEFCRLYNVTERGNFEGKSVPNRIGQTNEPWNYNDPRLQRIYEYRKSRERLHLDYKILLSWNSWTIASLSQAGVILDEPRYLSAAVRAWNFIREKTTDSNNRLFHCFRSGEAAYAGQLDDYAVYALASIELYRSTFETIYLQEAALRAKQAIDLFEDKENGGYYLTAHDSERLISRPKETYDGAVPSGNSVIEEVLAELAYLTGESLFREAADRQHAFMAGEIKNYPAAHCFSLTAMAKSIYPHKELICVGNRFPSEILSYFRNCPARNISVVFKSDKNEKTMSSVAPFTDSYRASEDLLWYLCEGGACRTPQNDFNMLRLS